METDVEDGPNWMFEEEEVKSNNPSYVFALHLIRNKFFICLQNIFVSILSLLNVVESGLLNRYFRMQYMRCINSVICEVLEKYGATYG
jgi:hypothetical protein